MKNPRFPVKPVAFAVLAALTPLPTLAADDLDQLRRTVEMLQKQLEQVQKQLEKQETERVTQEEATRQPQPAAEEAVTRAEVAQLQKQVAQASEWREPNTLVHMAGYADVGYERSQGNEDNGSFKMGRFAPIFHFQYRDLVMLESELEFTVKDDGETDTTLEYLTLDVFLNDYSTLVAGKFLSPVGQFRQNLHPSWINKMASAPPGFGHDGAAPVSEVGVQFRGGLPKLAGVRSNYAVYVSNGPELSSEDGELEAIDAEGFNKDADGRKVFGGRIGILPIPNLEIGLSGAYGKAAVGKIDGNSVNAKDQGRRDYTVYDADFNYHLGSLGLRGEYVKSKIGSTNKGSAASGSANWSTWYAQAAYKFLPTKWEAVLRYTDFDSALDSRDQKQWGVGINYLFAANFVAKLNYEFNDGKDNSSADDNRFVGQLAYGF